MAGVRFSLCISFILFGLLVSAVLSTEVVLGLDDPTTTMSTATDSVVSSSTVSSSSSSSPSSGVHVAAVTDVIDTVRKLEGGGFEVRRPTISTEQFDPLLMLDHFGPKTYAPGQALGAPDHPHRGQETVSYILKGAMQHKDSQGGTGELRKGDVQWMTAGRGVIHAEMPSDELMRDGGTVEGFQIWVNLPASKKMMDPRYQELKSASIPVYKAADNTHNVKVVTGRHEGVEAKIDTQTPIVYYDVQFFANSKQPLVLTPGVSRTFVYVYRGELLVGSNQQVVKEGQLAVLTEFADTKSKGSYTVPIECKSITDPDLDHVHDHAVGALVLGGDPLKEPVAWYGPFVMNTDQEIQQTLQDYRSGHFGKINH